MTVKMTRPAPKSGDTYLLGYIWHCGDDECDCTEPVIERIRPNPRVPRAVTYDHIWKGTFHSQASREERADQERELTDAVAALDEPVWVLDEKRWSDDYGSGDER